ncbi:MAG: Gfo/Idh/MocA family protein [Bryobacteraceae bacterium]
MKRRTFLATTAAGLQAAPGPPVKLGIIAEPTGSHLSLYLAAVPKCEGIGEVALADSTGGSFEKASGVIGNGLRTYRDPAEMLRSFRPDLALITLESHHMPPALRLALDAGCHVLSEKHPCVRFSDFEPLAQLSQRNHRHLMLAFATRYSPIVEKARQLVHSGQLGKLYSVDAYIIGDQARFTKPEFQRSWRARKSQAGGGYLMAVGIHYVDIIQHISGQKITRLCGFSRNVGGQPVEVDDANVAGLDFDGGMVGSFQSSCYLEQGYQSHFLLYGSNGWLRFSLNQGEPLQWYINGSGKQSFVDQSAYLSNQYLPLVQSAVRIVRGLDPPAIPVEESVHVLKTVFALYDASARGKTVTIV